MRRAALVVAWALVTCALAAGCADEPEDSCVTPPPEDCTPLYAPTFDNVFANTLSQSCGLGGSACHAMAGAKGGLVLDEPERAYEALLDGRVSPGDPGCSRLMARLEATGDDGMPPGSQLGQAERCAVAAWIRDGAAR